MLGAVRALINTLQCGSWKENESPLSLGTNRDVATVDISAEQVEAPGLALDFKRDGGLSLAFNPFSMLLWLTGCNMDVICSAHSQDNN